MPTGAEAPMGLDVSAPIEAADYFTEEEYRAVIPSEVEVGERTQWEVVERYQKEVIERLESWARTAWRPRVGTERISRRTTFLNLHYSPVTAISSITADGAALSSYALEGFGLVRWGDPSDDEQVYEYPTVLEVTYTYGFASPPWSVKRPCIEATHALVWRSDPESNIPPNTESYTQGGTTIRFAQVNPDDITMPWPWHEQASADIRAYWGPHRPRRVMVGA